MKKLLFTIMLCLVFTNTDIKTTDIDQFRVFSEFTLKRLLYIWKVSHPDIVFIQAQIESGHFKSSIFKENHNLFGMKMPERRTTVAIGINRGHAIYTSWQQSVLDYKLMQERYAKNKTRKEYFVYLKTYAEDPNYIKKIKAKL